MINKFLLLMLLLMFLFSCKKQNIKSPIHKEKENSDFIYIKGVIEKGQTVANALLEKGFDNTDVYNITSELNKIYDLRKSHPADSFSVKTDTTNAILEFKYMPSILKSYYVIKDVDTNDYITEMETVKLEKQLVYCSSEIKTSLWQAIVRNQHLSPSLALKYSQIFQWDIDFLIDPKEGDIIKFVAENYVSNQKRIKSGNILTATYIGKNYNKTAYRYKGKYYDKDGRAFQKAFLKSPLNYTRITSYFSSGRYHPVLKIVRKHNGVDFAAPKGTPVEAAADGIIIWRKWKGGHPSVQGRKGGYGKTVMIKHSNGYVTLYGHLSKYGKYHVGQKVKQHNIIGYVGSTGLSTGNHLHYTIYHNGKAINPLKLKNFAASPVSKSEIIRFKTVIDSLQNISNKVYTKSEKLQVKKVSIAHNMTSMEESKLKKERKKSNKEKYLWFLFLIVALVVFYFLYDFIYKRFVANR